MKLESDLDLGVFNEISARTPHLCSLRPGGAHFLEDLNSAGGVQAVMKELSRRELINPAPLTVTGNPVGENLKKARVVRPEVIRPLENPYHHQGGIAVLYGNIAPEGAVVKQSAVAPEMLTRKGRARVFESESDASSAILDGRIVAGDVVVIRYEGPKGGPGNAGDADADRSDHRTWPGTGCGAHNRWPVQWRHTGGGHRTYFA